MEKTPDPEPKMEKTPDPEPNIKQEKKQEPKQKGLDPIPLEPTVLRPKETPDSRHDKKKQNRERMGIEEATVVSVEAGAEPPISPKEKSLTKSLMKAYSTEDQMLNTHIFGNLELKRVDFNHPKIKAMIQGLTAP
jgi:hypothetical protein